MGEGVRYSRIVPRNPSDAQAGRPPLHGERPHGHVRAKGDSGEVRLFQDNRVPRPDDPGQPSATIVGLSEREGLRMGRAARLAGVIIVALMLAGTIPLETDDTWLWSLLALFLVATAAPGRLHPGRRTRTD